MKRVLWALAIVIVATLLYWFFLRSEPVDSGPKQAPLTVSKHSPAFNAGIDSLMAVYLSVKTAFVNDDSVTAKAGVERLIVLADSLKLDELKKDSSTIIEAAQGQLNDVKSNAQSLVKQPNITEMRRDFKMLSESMYPFLRAIHYEGTTLYWQNCPMAFGEGNEANWISNSEEVLNPYLGKNHPVYHATMLGCGSVQDSIKAN